MLDVVSVGLDSIINCLRAEGVFHSGELTAIYLS